MKKLLALVLTVLLVLSLTACVDVKKAENDRKENAVLLYENPGEETEATVMFDLDGEEREIKASVTEDNYISVYTEDTEIKLGFGESYYIYKIYGIDIDEKDKKKELVIITDEVSSDVMLRVLRLEDDEFKLISFENTDAYSGETYINDMLSVGYDAEVGIEGNRLKTSRRGRYGMWCVEAEYTFDGEMFTEVEIEERNIVRSSYIGMIEYAKVDSEYLLEVGLVKDETEIANLMEGYVTAHADFTESGKAPAKKGTTTIKEGDVFKITKEDSVGFVYIEKKEGKSGWVYLRDYSDNRSEVSEIAFFMAD